MANLHKAPVAYDYDDSPANSDEEADRVNISPPTNFTENKAKSRRCYSWFYQQNSEIFALSLNPQDEMLEKLQEMKDVFDENILSKMRVQQRKKGVSWLERLDIGNQSISIWPQSPKPSLKSSIPTSTTISKEKSNCTLNFFLLSLVIKLPSKTPRPASISSRE